ncbi:hypothetical protein H4Q26_010648 [Puccinia striiformis f. sp. tritici PST-130]|uniref:Tet-like 2OG-Fe(II) oxygenase domain-containing protein n=2 Tax=Puccinia striiformis TaxID=27350 RepID=A0A0L0VQ29_9BASI|nr:hypothetical protein H4Q26_010648 [Puccinia striiformis f. sp. tritici PST-130]KNF01317.1 hypothetical protein PSTG_05416 [Puccinia striiformis f. sp. tritici PST-78]
MWAIGWQKVMTKLEIVGQYVNTEAIKKNQEAFNWHVQDSDKASEILWKLFYLIGDVALWANQQFMVEHNLPAFSISQLPDSSNEPKLPFVFLPVIPTRKSTGLLALESNGYNMTDAIFAQRSYVHGTLPPNEPGDFTKVGLSMQIAQKTTKICDRVLAQEFVAKPSMHVGDVPHILNHIKK